MVCRDRFNPEEVLDYKKTLEQCGIFDGEIKLYYDYKPIVSPLLKWNLYNCIYKYIFIYFILMFLYYVCFNQKSLDGFYYFD